MASEISGKIGKIDHRSRLRQQAWVRLLETSIDQGFLSAE